MLNNTRKHAHIWNTIHIVQYYNFQMAFISKRFTSLSIASYIKPEGALYLVMYVVMYVEISKIPNT